MTPRDKAYLY